MCTGVSFQVRLRYISSSRVACREPFWSQIVYKCNAVMIVVIRTDCCDRYGPRAEITIA